jgi:DNA repair exonuclease SbcCD ATPase subunit/DNA repair exonuclease SbcCD nuclease subunit
MEEVKITDCTKILPLKVDKIFHIADIHLRLYKRQTEYRVVFNNLYKDLRAKATKNSIIYIGGDLFHSKNLLSPELIFYGREFLNTLSDIATVVIIPGNHDLSLSNSSRMDAITPIVKSLDTKPIIYSTNTEILEFDNLSIAHTSMYENAPVPAAVMPQNKLKFGAYHGTLNGAKNQYGFEFESENFNTTGFSGYDAVMLGHIHKYQEIGNIKYSSSLIQQDHGESLDKHGYIEWTINNNTITSAFVEVYNPQGYVSVIIDENGIHEPLNMPEIPTIKFIHRNISTVEFNKILTTYKLSHNIKGYSIIKEGDTKIENVGTALTNNIGDVSYQNKLLKNYLKERFNLDDNKIDKILELNTKYNESIDKKDIQIGMKWTPIKFEFSNMFSYGEDNVIDFTNLKGSVGLFGKNHSGKSSIIDALLYCIFEKCGRPTAKKINILNIRKNKFDCLFEFDFAGERHFIQRTGKRTNTGLTNTLNFWKLKGDERVNLNGADVRTTNKLIRNIFGNYEDVITTAFSLQDNKSGFIFQAQSERKNTWTEMLKISIFLELHKQGNKDLNGLKTVIALTEDRIKDLNIDDLNKELISLDEQISDLTHTNNINQSKLNDLNNKLANTKTKLINIDNGVRDIDFIEADILSKKREVEQLIKQENTKKVNLKTSLDKSMRIKNEEIETSKDRLLKLHEKVDNIAIEIDELDNRISTVQSKLSQYDIDAINNQYNQFIDISDIKTKLENEYNNKRIAIDRKRKTVKTLLELEYDKDCKYCVSNPFTQEAIQTKNNLNSDIEELKILEKKFNKACSIYDKLSVVSKDRDTITDLNTELGIYNASRIDLINEESSHKLLISEIEININKYKLELEKFQHKYISDIKEIDDKINRIVTKNEKELESLTNEILKYHENVKAIKSNEVVKAEIQELEINVLDQQNIITNSTNELIKLSQNKAILTNDIDRLKGVLNDLNNLYEKVELLDMYVAAVHKNGLPLQLITDTIPLLEQVTNDILSLIVDFTMKVELEDKNINIYIVKSEVGEWPIELCSGFEMFVSGLATRIAISKITNSNISNFIIVDEGWGRFDSDHIASANKLIQYLNTEYDFTLLITHIDIIKGLVNDYYTTEVDEEGFSHLII